MRAGARNGRLVSDSRRCVIEPGSLKVAEITSLCSTPFFFFESRDARARCNGATTNGAVAAKKNATRRKL